MGQTDLALSIAREALHVSRLGIELLCMDVDLDLLASAAIPPPGLDKFR